MKLMYRCANKAMGDKQIAIKKGYDRKRTDDPLQVGNKVLVYNPRMKNSKLNPQWEGPYDIINKSKNVYEVK